MKRWIAALLCLMMLTSLVACSSPEDSPETKKEETEDLSALSAEALYDRALSKTQGLVSARFETRVLLGEEEVDTIDTIRVRQGYDGFSYSREGEEKIYYNDGRIYVENRLGDFSADASPRQAEEYMTAYWYPVTSVPKESISGLEKDGMTLGFSLADEAVLALFAGAVPAEKGEFAPQSAAIACQVTQDGLLEKQSFTVTGTLSEETVTLTLETELKEYRSGGIEPSIPAAEHVLLGDIRIPHLLEESRLALEEADSLQATLLSSETVTAGEQKWALHREWTYYQPVAGSFYLSRQSLRSLPAAEADTERVEESLFYQILQESGTRTENEYNVILGEKRWENVGEAASSPWEELLDGILIPFSSLSQLAMTEELGKTSITFTLQDAGVKELAGRLAAALPEGGVDSANITATGSGVFTMDTETGLLTAFSVLLQGNTAEGQTISCQYSVNVDAVEAITLPQLQEPTPTIPGQGGDGEH